MEGHHAAVSGVSSIIRSFHSRKVPFHIYHGSTNSTRPQSFQHDAIVDMSSFTHILKIDPISKTALVEPNVAMDELVAATLQPYGLVPPVIMEFPGITVGGGFSGTGGESSSFRYGLFDRTVTWIEVVLGNGDVVTARPGAGKGDGTNDAVNEGLFWGVSGGFGTLGVVTMLEIRLVEAKRWVEVKYLPVKSAEEAVDVLEEKITDKNVEYVDGILFARDKGIIVSGRMVDSIDSGVKHPVQRFSRRRDEWFYIHTQQICQSSPREFTIEYVPLMDYLFRYDRGAFWVAQYAYDYFFIPFNRFTRWLLDYFMHTRVMYHALHQSGLSSSFIIQDMAVPWPAAGPFIDYLDKNFDRYPLWLCPIESHSNHSFHPQILPPPMLNADTRDTSNQMMLNIGLWAPGPSLHRAFLEANRALEHQLYFLRGTKWLYAQTFYTENEFWSIYNRDKYDTLREKYHASLLPSVYDKVRTDPGKNMAALDRLRMLRPLPGLYGAFRAALGGGYLLSHSKARMVIKIVAVCFCGMVLMIWLGV